MLGKRFLGVYGAEEAPDSLRRGTCLIMNTDNSNKPGIHWCALMRDDTQNTYFYDSYRRPYQSLSKEWRDKPWLQVINDPEQSMVSEICGHLSLALLYMFYKYGSVVLEIL